MAREDNIRLMEKMVLDIRKEFVNFEIMTDEEFYNSDYGYTRRQKGQRQENKIYFHCLVPGEKLNLISGYFTRGKIRFSLNSEYSMSNFKTCTNVGFKCIDERYWEVIAEDRDEDNLYEQGLMFMKEFLQHTLDVHPEYKKYDFSNCVY